MVNLPPGVAQTGVSISNKKQKITTGNVVGSMTRGSFQSPHFNIVKLFKHVETIWRN